MRDRLSNLNLFDEALNEIVQKYGGWPRLLDPSQATPYEFIQDLEKAGYSEYTFESIKSQIGKPEREYWITLLACIVKSMQKGEAQSWQKEMLDEFLSKIKEHDISDEEIRNAIEGDNLRTS